MSAKKAAAVKGEDGAPQPSFEVSMKRLEAIVGDMEAGKLNLEDMIARFEEGQQLISFCTKKLNEVEKKVEMLVKRGGTVKAEPFVALDAEDEPEEKDEPEKDELF
ncbi:MAG: exodeoxyribonuclease VII small subunit [Verrucomicrobia bacterium]|nr:exodeoxyribonuclease VII small subunit [Verrucomicrobiota bacterium]